MRSKDKLLTRDWKHKGVTRITSSHKTQPLQCSPGVSVTKHKAQVDKHSWEPLSSNIPYSLTFYMFLNVTVFSTDKKTAPNGSFWPSSPVRALLSSTQKTHVFSLKKIKKKDYLYASLQELWQPMDIHIFHINSAYNQGQEHALTSLVRLFFWCIEQCRGRWSL